MNKWLIFILVVMALGGCNSKKKTPVISSEDIFQTELFGQCHASTIVETGKGMFLSAWFGGSHEGASDVAIWGAGYKNGEWSRPYILAEGVVADSLSLPCWNPVLYKSGSERLFLFYKIGKNPREWWGMVKYSDDNGATWSDARQLPYGVLGPIKNKPVTLGDGRFLCPSSVETLDDQWLAHLELFNDDGLYLRTIPLDHGDEIGAIQPSILFYGNNTLQLLCRSRQNRIAQTWSFDGGESWEPLTLLAVQNPNSGTDAVTLSDGRQLLAYNPLTAGKEWWEGRNVLALAVSTDGITWKDVCELEHQPSGEYSYPAIIQDSEGMLHITYTWQRKRIKHVVVDPNQF